MKTQNSSNSENFFDVAIIGGGPGGYVAAIRAAQLGLKTVCIEKHSNLGGTCLNVGCIPSKALLEISHKFYDAKNHFSDIGIKVSEPKIEVSKLIENKNKIIAGLASGIVGLFKKNKVARIAGTAKFLGSSQVEVLKIDGSKEIIEAKNFVIATGSQVMQIPGIEIDEKIIVSSSGALELSSVPKKMVVIGAGVIGLELGSVWSRLGAEVEVIEFQDKITPTMDFEISRNFQKILEKQGLKFRLATKVLSASKDKKGAIVEVEEISSGKKEKIAADVVLVAVGRRPNSSDIGLESLEVKVNSRGFIENHHLQTNVKNIYAIGDVTTGPMLAHKAEDEGVAVAEIIAGQAGHVNYETIPNVIGRISHLNYHVRSKKKDSI